MIPDVFAREALENPYDLYRLLRADSPVHQIASTGIWLVTRYADLVEAASKPDIFSSHISALIYAGEGPTPTVIQGDPDAIGAVDVLATADPPAHSAQRKLMNRTFPPARIAESEPVVASFVEEVLDRCIAPGEIEWMSELANPLPISVIAGILGMPASDLDDLVRWADAGIDLLSGVASQERMLECWQMMIEFLAYMRARLADPAPGSVSAFVSEAVGRGDLSGREGVSLLLQLVIAGSESTTSLLGSAVRILAEDPALQDELRARPERIPTFLEEVLRLESPFRGHFRVTTQATSLGGVDLPEGARLMLMWGAANRDGEAFPSPDRLDLDRDHPKAHVGFGSGIHFCLGAPLARMEARVTLERLLARTSNVALASRAPAPRHVPSLFVRRLESLPLSLVSNRAHTPG